jgi:TonB family protein
MVKPVYPGVTGQGTLQGRVAVKLSVDEAGEVQNVEIVDSTNPALN